MLKRASTLFVGILLIMALLYVLLANAWMKRYAEQALTSANGAEVNIADFEHSLFPLRISFGRTQFTDPTSPSNNRIDIEAGNVIIEFLPLLSSEIIINDMTLNNITVNTPRKAAGVVLPTSDGGNGLAKLGDKVKALVPTVDELLANSPLRSTQASQEAYLAITKQKEALAATREQLPTRERIDYYRQEVDKLKQLSLEDPAAIIEAKKALQALQNDIRQDKQKIANFKRDIETATESLKTHKSLLQSAYKSDYTMLSALIEGDQAALQQVTSAMFGKQVSGYLQHALAAAEFVAPFLEGKAEGEPKAPATPLFVWLKHANVSFFSGSLKLVGTIENFSNNLSRSGMPASYQLNSLTDGILADVGGLFSQENGILQGKQTWQLSGVPLLDHAMGGIQDVAIQVAQASLHSQGALTFSGGLIDGGGSLNLTQLSMSALGDSKLAANLNKALHNINDVDAKVALSGELYRPNLQISSDLDKQLAGFLFQQATSETQGKLTELDAKLSQVVGAPLTETEAEQQGLQELLASALEDESTLETLLTAQVSGAVEKGKRKLFDKLTDKLGKP